MSAWNRIGTSLLLASSLLSGISTKSVQAETITWTGNGDGTSWGQAANWDLGRTPTSSDDVIIPDVAGTSVIIISATAGFGSLACAEDLRLTAGYLYVWGDGTVDADFEYLGGRVVGNNHTTTLTVNGLFRWICSTTLDLDSLTVVAAGSVEFSGAGWKSLYNSTLVIDGPGTIADKGISIGAYPLQLGPGADLHVLTNGVQFSGTVGTSIEGTLVLEPGVSATMSNTTVAASGLVQVSDSGTLTMSWSHYLWSSGTIDLGDGAVLSGNISLSGTANVTGTGTLQIAGTSYFHGTHQIDAGIDLLAYTVTIDGATTVNGPFTMISGSNVNSGGAGAVLTLNGPATMNGGNMSMNPAIATGPVTVAGNWGVGGGASVFEHRGRLDWTAGNISIAYSNTLRTAAGAEFHAYVNGATLGHYGSGGVSIYDNQGLCVIESGASITTTNAMRIVSSGPLDIGAATLSVTLATVSGNVSIGADGLLLVDSNDYGLSFAGDANITGGGTLRLNASTCSFTGTHIVEVPVEQHGTTVSVSGTATFNGPYNHTAGWLSGGPGGTAILNSDLTWTGGHLGGGGFVIIINGNTTAHFPDGCLLFGTLINHGVFTQTGLLAICGDSSFVNYGQHWLYGRVSCCTYSCGIYQNLGGDLVMGPNSSIAFSLSKDGRGDRGGEGTYEQSSGSTFLDGATLTADGGINLLGGMLRGNGVVEGAVISAAGLAPGLSPGHLAVTGMYTQNATGGLAIEIAGPNPGTDYDVLAIADTAALSGSLTVMLDPAYDPPVGATFDILTADVISGEFDGVELPPPFGPNRLRLTYLNEVVRVEVVSSAGDLNCDGAADFDDVPHFVQALIDPAGYAAAHPDCSINFADTNEDGLVNGLDIQPFVGRLLEP